MSNEDYDMFGDDTHGNDLLQGAVDIADHNWPERLTEMVEVLASAAERNRIAPSVADALKLARFAVLVIAEHFGGRQTYLPRGDSLRLALRDNEMWHEYKGRPEDVDRLAVRHNLSSIRVYSILAKQRELHRAKVQPQLSNLG